jgi:tetratricopeptide (TPR) repeat protein
VRHAEAVTLTADELYRRGLDHTNGGRNGAARRALTAAAARCDDADLRARIAGTLAYVVDRTGDPDAARRLCLDALEDARVSARTAAIVRGQLGVLALHHGAVDEAITWLDRAIHDIGDDPEHRASMLMNRSVAHMQERRLAAARADLERAAGDYARTDRAVDAAMAEHNRGYVALLEGDLVQALARMARARRAFEESPVNSAIGDLDRAEVLRDAGLTTEAERILERVAGVFGSHRMRQARAEAEVSLARSLLTHSPARAARVARAAARRFAALGSESWTARADAVRLRALLAGAGIDRTGAPVPAAGRPPAAAEVEATAGMLDRHGLRADAAALRLAQALSAARRGSPLSLPLRVHASAPLEVRLLAHEVGAARAAQAGRDAAARRVAARGLAVLEASRRQFGSLDLQTSIAMQGAGLLGAGLAAALRSARPDVVFAWSERARHMSQQMVPLRPPPDPRLAAELAELRQLRAENPAGDWLEDSRAAALRDRARERQWESMGTAGVQARIGLPGARAMLADGESLLSYVFDGVRLVALAVGSEGTRSVELDWTRVRPALTGLRADLDMSASVQAGPLAGVVQRALQDRLARLSALLVDPVLAPQDSARVVITVPGVLTGVPWTMLPAMRGRVLTLAPSISRWAALRTEAGTRPAPRRAGFVVGPRVARGDEEARVAASAWPRATVATGGDATVDRVATLAGAVEVLHLAAHGRHAVDNPLFSGLELADGALFGYDIDRMPRVPDVIVLSACEGGRSSVRWGEEAIGMTRAWLHAGSACVIATPVVVADDIACELLAGVHEGLAAGLAPAVALADATVKTGHIAPFLCHGAGF